MKAILGIVVAAVTVAFVPSSKEEDLHDHMMGLMENLKSVAQGVRGGDLEACLEPVTRMQEHAMAAKLLSPANLDSVPEAARDEHTRSFRIAMVQLLSELSLLEIEILEGDSEKAWNRVSGSLFELRESSHERFQEPE